MEQFEITQSLLSSWNYAHTCSEALAGDAMNSFLLALRGEQEEPSDDQRQNIQNGIDFENMVYARASGKPIAENPKWERGIETLSDILRGAQFQVRIHKPIEVRGMHFVIHGVLDALKAGTIYDIKFKNKSFGSIDLPGDYFDSPQHQFYFYLVPEAREFIYLVSDGQDIFLERYTPCETIDAAEIIAEFMDFLERNNLMETYKSVWREDS